MDCSCAFKKLGSLNAHISKMHISVMEVPSSTPVRKENTSLICLINSLVFIHSFDLFELNVIMLLFFTWMRFGFINEVSRCVLCICIIWIFRIASFRSVYMALCHTAAHHLSPAVVGSRDSRPGSRRLRGRGGGDRCYPATSGAV